MHIKTCCTVLRAAMHVHMISRTKHRHATEHLTGAGVVCCETRYLDTLTHS